MYKFFIETLVDLNGEVEKFGYNFRGDNLN